MPPILNDRLQNIWAHLRDDLSKEIFLARLRLCLTSDYNSMSGVIDAAVRDWRGRHGDGDTPPAFMPDPALNAALLGRVAIYGAGMHGGSYFSYLGRHGVPILCYSDSDSSRHGGEHFGLPLVSPEEMVKKYNPDTTIIAIEDERAVLDVHANLLNLGYGKERIFRIFPLWKDSYFIKEIFSPKPHAVYIDGGSYDDKTIKKFVDFCGGDYDKIFALEPDPGRYPIVVDAVKKRGYERVEILPNAASSDGRDLHFSKNTSLDMLYASDNGEITVPGISIDSLDTKATFIKMDIEGSELDALVGARKTIATHAPDLAICVYHKGRDILDIPEYLLELVPDYRLHLRHHSVVSSETVLYATINR